MKFDTSIIHPDLMYTLQVQGDTNDADYNTSEYDMNGASLRSFIEIYNKLVERKEKHGNIYWCWDRVMGLDTPTEMYGDILSEDDISWFGDWLPYRIHSITRIRYYTHIQWVQVF